MDTGPVDEILESYSDLRKLKKGIAWWRRYLNHLRGVSFESNNLTLDEVDSAELQILKYVQRRTLTSALKFLGKETDRKSQRWLKRSAPMKSLAKLGICMIDGVIRIGGRLDRAPVPFEVKHPAILPPEHHFTKLVIRHFHRKAGHSGVSYTWSLIREKYWIISARLSIRRELNNCVTCRKINAPVGQQIMAELPKARVEMNQEPFFSCGTDFFGPLLIKRGRSEVKRYGFIFTCLTIRAVHVELAEDLSTDAFINALRRFVSRRTTPSHMYSDNGTNYVGAQRILQDTVKSLNQQRINDFCLEHRIKWHFNPPTASNQGGAWEIMVRSIKRMIYKIFYKLPAVAEDVLRTALIEFENILNSRPLTPVSFEPGEFAPLTPNHLLKIKPVVSVPPGIFDDEDICSRSRWKQVQVIANEFWRLWQRDYLPTIAM